MSAPPAPVYSAPHVSANVPWDVRVHLQTIYQKLGNHLQAFTLQQQAIESLKAGTAGTTTPVVAGGISGGGSVPISLGGVNNQTGHTTYTTTAGDDGVILLLNDASPVAVTLTSAVDPPFYLTASNAGAGLVTFTPTSGTINGGATFTLGQFGLSVIVFDGTNWSASSVMIAPQNTPAVAGEFLTAYNGASGAFTQAAPTGYTGTITTAQLTTLGTQGSMTFANGLLISEVPAT